MTGVVVPLATVDDKSVPAVPSVNAATEVTVPPVPVAEIVIAPEVFEILTPLPGVRVVRVKPVPLPISSTPLAGVVVRPVPPLATARVPPSVRVPVVVIGPPDKVSPVVPPDPLTLVTVPEPLLLNVFQSVLDRYPSTEVVAAGILMAGVDPPLETTGAVPVTLVTVPDTPVRTPPDRVRPPATLISSAAPVLAVVRPSKRLVDIVRPLAEA